MTLQHWFARTPTGLRSAFLRALNLYPPFVGAGIRILHATSDLSCFDVEMRLRPWNRNLVGAHLGGSLYAMCDPFVLVALTTALGPDFLVWDKSARIDFRRPGRGTVRARFAVTPAQIAEIRAQVETAGKSEPHFAADVVGPAGEVIATVHKHLWVKRKPADPASVRREPRHVQPAV